MAKVAVAVVDYGMGNLRSVAKALEIVGADVTVTGKPKAIGSADAVVFPGVGSFGPAVDYLKRAGLQDAIRDVIVRGTPFLGLCLGFQLLFSSSEEEGIFHGLDVIKGRVAKFSFGRNTNVPMKVPHMGWNRVAIAKKELRKTMFNGIPDKSYFYFVHSYYGSPVNRGDIAGTTEYGFSFCSAAVKGNAWACQFHPEKSGETGLRLLKNFVQEVKRKC